MTTAAEVLGHLVDAQAVNDLEGLALHNPHTPETDSLSEWIVGLPLPEHVRAQGLRFLAAALHLNTRERHHEHSATGLIDEHAELGREIHARGMTCKQIARRLAPHLRATTPHVQAVSAVRRELATAGPKRLASRGVAGELSPLQGERLRTILAQLSAAPVRGTRTADTTPAARPGSTQ